MKNNVLYALSEVSKVYGKDEQNVTVFSDLNMTIREKEFVSITGPSGSGKTTLLNLLGGVDRADRGNVFFRDKDLAAMSNHQLSAFRAEHIGFVFQNFNLMPALTAEDNVEVPLFLRKMPYNERRKKVQVALELVGLGSRAKHKPAELSGGQAQRVAIARAVVGDPSILLCDEPTGNLDRENAKDIMEMLQTLNKVYGKAVIMVTHDQEVAKYCQYSVTMDKGVMLSKPIAKTVVNV